MLSELLERGWTRISGAFSADDAAAMRDIAWKAMATMHGIDRDDPSTWRMEAPTHLDVLKGAPELEAVGSPVTRAAIDEVLGTDRWTAGRGWGAQFMLFPVDGPFDIASGTWHCDSLYTGPIEPLDHVQVITIYGDVAPHAGGMQIVEGSHRVIARCMATGQVPTKHASQRKMVMRSHAWLAGLTAPATAEERVRRFMEEGGDIDGLPVRVVELGGSAGDVFLVHPLTLHARPRNAGTEPRFMLSTFARKVRP